ncbi:DUF5819 family protein [Streptomyces sp. NPDC018833]|uniref:DUF5819 family protein n=1 Tax=Streptomyces sp. NPDC018833 TaxID=3365053 RepID=UPI00378947BC
MDDIQRIGAGMELYEHKDGSGGGSLNSGPPPPRPPEDEAAPALPPGAVPAQGAPAATGPATGIPATSTAASGMAAVGQAPTDPAPAVATPADPAMTDTGTGATAAAPGTPRPTRGIAALSMPYQVLAVVSLTLVAALVCVHLTMVFLHVAPPNTVTKRHGEAVQGWVYPEFEQNWKLFGPNPLQQNIAVEARAQYTAADGSRRTSEWIDLSAQDGEAIRGNPVPSHIHQNQLRRGWDFFLGSHDNEARPDGLRGRLSERYIRRIVMLRLNDIDLGGPVQRVQVRSSTRAIAAPAWSGERVDTRPVHRLMPWWTITEADLPGGVDSGRVNSAGTGNGGAAGGAGSGGTEAGR